MPTFIFWQVRVTTCTYVHACECLCYLYRGNFHKKRIKFSLRLHGKVNDNTSMHVPLYLLSLFIIIISYKVHWYHHRNSCSPLSFCCTYESSCIGKARHAHKYVYKYTLPSFPVAQKCLRKMEKVEQTQAVWWCMITKMAFYGKSSWQLKWILE